MKKITLLFVSIFALGTLNSCSSDNSSDNIDENKIAESGKLQVNFDGQTFESGKVQAVLTGNQISINALRLSKGDFVQINVPARTYTWKNIDVNKDTFALAYSPSVSDEFSTFINFPQEDVSLQNANYTDDSTITITSINTTTKKISGTFQFTGLRYNSLNKGETKVFTKGSFTDISFVSEIVVKNDNTLSVKVDNVNFVPTTINATSSMGKLNIYCSKGLETVTLFVPNTIKAGNYTVGDSSMNYVLRYSKDMTGSGIFDGQSGTITILSHDISKKTISGTFTGTVKSYTANEKHELTAGSFSVSY